MLRARRGFWVMLLLAYAAGVLATNIILESRRPFAVPLSQFPETIDLPPMADTGPVAGDPLTQIYWSWGRDTGRPPVVLLHGSPGSASNFQPFGDSPGLGVLVAADRRAFALDLPGMGGSRSDPPTWSALSHAHAVLAFMDELRIDRAHVVGWSNGGAVALNMADIDADRVASIVMLGSVGAQAAEGSGSYLFEHAKYEVGIAATHATERLTPHFGLLDLRDPRRGLRNFDDTDQRPLAGIMSKLRTPTLILHGRDDFLVADWAAEYHHELIPSSTLVMTEHDHFMPFLAAEETAEHISEFIGRFDDPSAEPMRATVDLAPRVQPFGAIGEAALDWLHFAPVWLVLPLVTLVGATLPGRAWVAVLVGATELDIGVAWLGLALGKGIRTVRNGNGRRPMKWLGVLFDPLAQLGLGFFFTQLIARPLIRLGPEWAHGVGWVLAVLALAAVLIALPRIWTRRGRQRLLASISRATNHEWWPSWALYAPLVPWLVWLTLRHRHPLAFTACNPDIPNGGGLAGESKSVILNRLLAGGDERVLFGVRVEGRGPPDERARRAGAMLASDARLGGWPVILKPDAGEQGRGVRLCRTPDDLLRFFESTPGPALLQRYHPGPFEIGVFFVRDTDAGRVFSVTRKVFPTLRGDGRRTVEQLIWRHRRYRCQAALFLTRLGDRGDEVLAAGETLQLTSAGNHAQGCRFEDGADLLTPELEAAVRAVADGFGEHGLDFGRFDLRASSLEACQRGDFAVVEVNGVTSESTNIYDPRRSAWFAWRTLAKQCSLAYAIGACRRARGHLPLPVWRGLAIIFGHLRTRPER